MTRLAEIRLAPFTADRNDPDRTWNGRSRRAHRLLQLSGISLHEAGGGLGDQLIATVCLLQTALPACPKIRLELCEDGDVRTGEAIDRLPVVTDGKDFGEWPLVFQRLDQVRSGFRDILELIDEDQGVGALILARLDELRGVGDRTSTECQSNALLTEIAATSRHARLSAPF